MMCEVDDLSGSMTPPLSPSLDDLEAPASKRQKVETDKDITVEDLSHSPVHFQCSKRGTGVSSWQPAPHWLLASNGYLATGSLRCVLHGADPDESHFQGTITKLYSYNHVTYSALVHQTKLLFYLTRQKLCEFGSLVENTPFLQRGLENSQVQCVYKECCHFLQYVKVFIYRYYSPSIPVDPYCVECEHIRNLSEFPSLFLHHISGLINHLGSLFVLQQKSLSKELLHLHLDFHWSIAEILHLFSCKVKDLAVHSEVCQLFNTHVKKLLWDLILIASTNHRNVSQHQYHQTTIFQCSCFQEMWVLLLQLLDHRHQQMSSESFWCHIYSILHTILRRQIPEEILHCGVPEDSLQTVDVQGLCWWLILHLAPLYQYDELGQLAVSQIPLKNNWLMVQDLWKAAFSQNGTPEESKVRCYLHCCIALAQIWECNIKLIAAIWERYHKRLNESFHIPGLGLQEFATNTKKTGAKWFEECFYRCQGNDGDHLKVFNEKANSFGLFLNLLALQLQKSKKAPGNQGWKQLKGRFYSKFHQRGMQELTETGLSHFIDLFLTLAMTAGVEEVSGRMCDLLDLLPSNKINLRKRMVIWKGLFALILIYEDKNLDVKVLAHRLASQFNQIVRDFNQMDSDPSRRHQYWELLNSYLDGIQEIFERSTYLNLSEDELIAEGFLHILPVCKEYELQAALTCIQTLLVQHRSVSKRALSQSEGPNRAVFQLQHKAIAAALWKNVYPFIKSHSTTMTAPSQLADIAVNFTLLAIDSATFRDPSTPSFLSLVQYFGLQDTQVNASICCQYLYHILPNQTIMDKVQKEIGADFQKQIIHAWFRCALLTFKPTEQMQELTRFLWKIPEFAELANAGVEVTDHDLNTEVMMCRVLKEIGHRFNETKTFQERVSLRDRLCQYLGDVVKYVTPTLKSAGPQYAMNWIYHICGSIVKYTAKIIYVQGKPQCLLPAILDSLVVPHALFNPNKSIPGSQLTAIRENLSLFLDGFAVLDYKRDPYLQRRIKDIVTQYFNRFQMRASVTAGIDANLSCSTSHPFLTTLLNLDTASEPARNFQHFLLEQICTTHLVPRNNQLTPVITNTLVFLKELYKQASVQNTARTTLLVFGPTLDVLLIAESTSVSNVKKLAIGVLQSVLDAYQKVPHLVPRDKVETALRVFIIKNFRMAYIRVLHVLEALAIMCAAVVADVTPKLVEEVYQVEMKRGVGKDKNLRRAVCKVLDQLGEVGRSHIALLMEDL